jgi:hypothetical protein
MPTIKIVQVAPYRQVARRNVRGPQALILHIDYPSVPKFKAS